MYLVGFAAPLVYGIVLRTVSRRSSTAAVLSIYGYVYLVFVIAALIAIVPNDYVQWIALIYAGVTSIVHLTVSLNK